MNLSTVESVRGWIQPELDSYAQNDAGRLRIVQYPWAESTIWPEALRTVDEDLFDAHRATYA